MDTTEATEGKHAQDNYTKGREKTGEEAPESSLGEIREDFTEVAVFELTPSRCCPMCQHRENILRKSVQRGIR